jgi:FeS assembly protein IscX
MCEPLSWDTTYAIARELMRRHPDSDPGEVSLNQIYLWTITLPDFDDDPDLANESILEEIVRVWYEEQLHDNQ